MDQIIGTHTKINKDSELSYLNSYPIRILAVMKDGARVESDEELEALGGIVADDTVIVAPIVRGQPSRYGGEPLARELTCFHNKFQGDES